MSVAKQSSLARSPNSQLTYNFYDLGNNKIPEAERVHLREKDWEILW